MMRGKILKRGLTVLSFYVLITLQIKDLFHLVKGGMKDYE